MPSGGPEYRGDVKYMNAEIEYTRRKERLQHYLNELKLSKNNNYQRFLEKKIERLRRMVGY